MNRIIRAVSQSRARHWAVAVYALDRLHLSITIQVDDSTDCGSLYVRTFQNESILSPFSSLLRVIIADCRHLTSVQQMS